MGTCLIHATAMLQPSGIPFVLCLGRGRRPAGAEGPTSPCYFLICAPTIACLPSCSSQDSTLLWESLPAEVMDSAVKMHAAAIRKLLLKFK